MSNTPIYDEITNFKTVIKTTTLFRAKTSIIKWIEDEVKAGRIKATKDIEKILKMIGELKWEDTRQPEKKSTGEQNGCTCTTNGTPSKSQRSSVSVKKSARSSRPSSPKDSPNEKLD